MYINAIFLTIIFIAASGFSYCLCKNIVLILNGTGSAGKTSIAKLLESQWQKEKRRVEFIEWDSVALEVIKSTMKQKDPDLDINLSKAVLFKNFLQKFGVDNLIVLLDDIEKSIIKKTNEFLAIDGSIVIIDMTLDTQKAIEKVCLSFEHNPLVLHVLIYCSLPSLLNHAITRNKLNISTEKRDILHILENRFMKMYVPQCGTSKKIVDSISKREFDTFSLKAKSDGENSGIDNEEIKKKFDRACRVFTQKFGLIESNIVTITPNFSYDFVVNNSEQTSEDSAMQIKRFVPSECL